MTNGYILVADDEPNMRRVLEIMLRKSGHTVFVAADGQEALEIALKQPMDLIITDMRMPGLDGIGLLTRLREAGADTPVIVVTAHGSVESAVDAMRRGAADYLLRPFDADAMELTIQRVLSDAQVTRQNAFLREELARGWEGFIGTSAAMQAVFEQIRQVAPSRTTVMITGETGTGKELVARALHGASPRASKLFVPINCAAIPADMLESELFGHEKGAFTGAVRERVGKFELAEGGTLFLDEVTEMPMALQAKLLRVLQEGSVERLGSNRSMQLDFRLIAATNRDPRQAVRDGQLREDLFYRLNVFALSLPALRERKEDIGALVEFFAQRHGRPNPGSPLAEPGLYEHLARYDWPGNVRELENMVERASVLAGAGPLRKEHFPLHTAAPDAVPDALQGLPEGGLNDVISVIEQRMIADALARCNDNKARAAALLGISERTLWYKIRKYRADDV
jgi:two-component system response regulator AtoC